MKFVLTPFTAIAIMLVVVVGFSALTLILPTLSSIDLKNILSELNSTTERVQNISKINNDILDSNIETLSVIQNLSQTNNQILESTNETLNIIKNISQTNSQVLKEVSPPNPVFFEHFNDTDVLSDKIDLLVSEINNKEIKNGNETEQLSR